MPLLTNEYLNFHPELPLVFYHYCSVNTFLGIIENNNIWLSDVENLVNKKAPIIQNLKV